MSTGPEHDGSLVSATVAAGLGMSAGSRAARFRHGRLRGSGLWGFNSGFMGVQLGFEVISGRFAGLRPSGGNVRGSGWNMLSSLPDEGTPSAGAAARSWRAALVPLPRDCRFCRSGACIGRTSGRCRRCSLAGMPGRAPRLVLAWTGDGPPIRVVHHPNACSSPSDTLNPHERPVTGMLDRHPRPASGRSGCFIVVSFLVVLPPAWYRLVVYGLCRGDGRGFAVSCFLGCPLLLIRVLLSVVLAGGDGRCSVIVCAVGGPPFSVLG